VHDFGHLYLILLDFGECVPRQIYILTGDFESEVVEFVRHEQHLGIDCLELFIYELAGLELSLENRRFDLFLD